MNIIHSADLHLSVGEREYSFSVLEEIVGACLEHRASCLVLAGDLFDSFVDAEALRSEFRDCIGRLKDRCTILFLPGNHERLKQGGTSLKALDLGHATLLGAEPFCLWAEENVEILGIPHRDAYGDYREWDVPAKRSRFRIAVAHATVIGMSYAGIEEEPGATAIDPDLFARFQVDYAALGHIHARKRSVHDGVTLAYPGSARVWRRGESGPHGFLLVSVGATLEAEFFPLQSAGTFREYTVPLTLEGEIEDVPWGEDIWQPNDWVSIELSGVVEDENTVAAVEQRLISQFSDTIRRLQINRDGVTAFHGIASHPIAQRFIAAWKALEHDVEDDDRRRVWLRARELALQEMKSVMEAHG